MSIVQCQNQTALYFALKKSSRGKRTKKFNGSMTISKTLGKKGNLGEKGIGKQGGIGKERISFH